MTALDPGNTFPQLGDRCRLGCRQRP
jgi:hypothetical protein